MSRIIIFAVLGIASTALAEDLASCKRLNSIKNYTHSLNPSKFNTELERCVPAAEQNASLSIGTIALLKVFKAIHNQSQDCAFDKKMEYKLIKCVTSTTGFKDDEFTLQAAKLNFALNTTEALVFDTQSCQHSASIFQCIEKKFSEEKVGLQLKGCKDKIIRGFNETEALCRYLIHLDQNSGFYEIPSKSLIFGLVAMLAKLTIFSQ